MKKILLLVVILLFLTSCQPNNKEKIGLLIKNTTDEKNITLLKSTSIRAYQLNYDLVVVDSLDNEKTQKSDFLDLIDQNIKVIAIDPIDLESISSLIEKANKKGIKVIILSDKSLDKDNTVTISPDYKDGGMLLSRLIKDKEGSILQIIDEKNYNKELIDSFNNILVNRNIIKFILGDDHKENINNLVEELTRNNEIKIVLTPSEKVYQIFSQALAIYPRNDIINLSVGDSKIIKDAIINDKLYASLAMDYNEYGEKIVEVADNWLKNKRNKTNELIYMKIINKEE